MAVDLAMVQEVLTLGPVTPVPGAPGGVVGVVAVQGMVLPVLDLRASMDLPGAGTIMPARQGDTALRLRVPPHELLLLVSQAREVVDEVEPGVELLDLRGLVEGVANDVADAANHFQVHPFEMAAMSGPGGGE